MASRILRARRASVSLLLCGVASLALTAPLAAQSYYDGETVVIGGGNAPRGSVTVDMGALDAVDGGYNPPSAAPARPGGRIVLTPPKSANAPAKSASAPAKPAAPRSAAAAPARPAAAPSRPAAPAPAAVASAPATSAPTPTRPTPAPTPMPAPEPPPAPTAAATPAPAPTPAPASTTAASRPAPTPVPTRPTAAPTPAPAPAPATTASRPAAAPAPAPSAAPEIRSFADMPDVQQAEPVPAPAAAAPALAPSPAPVPQPPAMPAGESQALRIGFSGETTTLPEPSKSELKGVVETLTKNAAMRVQVKAYASGKAEDASKARRTSLSRALAVRSYLIDQGIGSTRIDVRALGNNAEGGPGDRVDLVLVAR